MQTKENQNDVIRGKSLLSLPVYSIAEGRFLGEIVSVLIRREDFTVAFVGIKLSGTLAYVPFSAIKTVGADIVLIEAESQLQSTLTPEQQEGLEKDLTNRPAFTQSGQSAGRVVGFSVDTTTACIEYMRIEADSGFWSKLAALGKDTTVPVPIWMVESLGTDAVIVQDAVVALLAPDSVKH